MRAPTLLYIYTALRPPRPPGRCLWLCLYDVSCPLSLFVNGMLMAYARGVCVGFRTRLRSGHRAGLYGDCFTKSALVEKNTIWAFAFCNRLAYPLPLTLPTHDALSWSSHSSRSE